MIPKRAIAVVAFVLLAAGLVPAAALAQDEGLAAAQSRVRERMRRLELRLLSLSSLLQSHEPERAERLRRALGLSRERFVLEDMARIRSLLEAGRYGEAAQLEEEVIEELHLVAEALTAEAWPRESGRLMRALAALDELIDRQAELADLTGEAIAAADAARYAGLSRLQGTLSEDTGRLRGEAGEGAGAGALEAALARKGEAEAALVEARGAEALAAQAEALRQLRTARRAMADALRSIDSLRRMRARQELRDLFRRALDQHGAVRRETAALSGELAGAEAPTRSRRLAIVALARRQQGVVGPLDDAIRLLEEDGTTLGLPGAVAAAGEDVETCAELLAEGVLDARVLGLQQDVEAALEALLEALEARRPATAEDMAVPERLPEEGLTERPPLVNLATELKAVRAFQAALNAQTERLTARREQGRGPADELRAETERLAERQRRLALIVAGLRENAGRGGGR